MSYSTDADFRCSATVSPSDALCGQTALSPSLRVCSAMERLSGGSVERVGPGVRLSGSEKATFISRALLSSSFCKTSGMAWWPFLEKNLHVAEDVRRVFAQPDFSGCFRL